MSIEKEEVRRDIRNRITKEPDPEYPISSRDF